MAKIKKYDFVELEYTGTIVESKSVFDTTNREIAQREGIFSEESTYGPVTICVGEGQLIQGIEQFLESAEVPGEATIIVKPEQAFGKKDSRLLHLVPSKKFIEQQIQPVVGLQINIDGLMGTIKTVGGGRVIVDFNHPLASKEVEYTLKIHKIVDDEEQKIKSLVHAQLGIEPTIENNEQGYTITVPKEIPQDIQKIIIQKIQERVSPKKGISFSTQNK